MGYNLQISLRARNDVVNAIDYYDAISSELCDRFLSELSETYKKLVEHPQFHSLISSNPKDQFRDIKLKSFPYVVIYEIHETKVIVTAVMNTSQKPFIP
jgi:plasmid stabilization system protein ParE